MTDRDLLEYIASQVGKLTQDAEHIKEDVEQIKDEQTDVSRRVTKVEIVLEISHLSELFFIR